MLVTTKRRRVSEIDDEDCAVSVLHIVDNDSMLVVALWGPNRDVLAVLMYVLAAVVPFEKALARHCDTSYSNNADAKLDDNACNCTELARLRICPSCVPSSA